MPLTHKQLETPGRINEVLVNNVYADGLVLKVPTT